MSYLNASVNKILKKIKDGDSNSLNELFKLTYNHLLIFARRYLLEKSKDEDVVCDSFVAVYKYIQTFDETKDGYNWICEIVKNKALNENRKTKTTTPISENIASVDIFDDINNKTDLHNIIKQLDKLDQKILIYRYFYNYTLVEIAKLLGLRTSFVGYRLKIILKQIKKLL